jgi:hypothetical protein
MPIARSIASSAEWNAARGRRISERGHVITPETFGCNMGKRLK